MKSKGYSLIELMVVVAILGIISAVAFPTYQGYMRDTYQAQAASDLKLCALAIDRFYSNGFTYVGADSPAVCTGHSPSDAPFATRRYTMSYVTLTKNNYLIRMTPVNEGQCIQLSADGTQSSC